MHSLITKLWSQMKNIVLERILYLTEDKVVMLVMQFI